MKKTIAFTKEGYEKIEKDYAELKNSREAAVKELSIARDMGDRSENAAYKSARWKLSTIDRQLRHLSNLLRFGKVVEREFTGKVDIGCKVTVYTGTEEKEFTIVGGYESDIMSGKISTYSPIGKALMGKKVDDIVKIRVPAGELTYKIIAIS